MTLMAPILTMSDDVGSSILKDKLEANFITFEDGR
jgi:hypothetical protein